MNPRVLSMSVNFFLLLRFASSSMLKFSLKDLCRQNFYLYYVFFSQQFFFCRIKSPISVRDFFLVEVLMKKNFRSFKKNHLSNLFEVSLVFFVLRNLVADFLSARGDFEKSIFRPFDADPATNKRDLWWARNATTQLQQQQKNRFVCSKFSKKISTTASVVFSSDWNVWNAAANSCFFLQRIRHHLSPRWKRKNIFILS